MVVFQDLVDEVDKTTLFVSLAASYAIYVLGLCIYRIWFHPLSHIPGPYIAIVGPWYEFYHEVLRDGQYLWEIEKMHEKYGNIVRVTHREVHIRDPYYYQNIYAAGNRKTDKDPDTVGAFDVPGATAGTVDHETHRTRRGYLNPYFSKRSITSLEPTVHERITKACERIEEHIESKEPLSLDGVFCALTADVISSRFYGINEDYLSIPDFHFVVRDGFLGLTKVYHLARFFPLLVTVLKKLPYACIRMIIPAVADLLVMRDEIAEKGVGEFMNSHTADSKSSVLVGALGNPAIPDHERTVGRLLDEGTVILFAGTETTSRTLCVIMYYLISNPDVLKKLREELSHLPDTEDYKHTLQELENLPYLSAVINEGLRLTFGPISRSSRAARDMDLVYNDKVIPRGTPVSQSTYFMHSSELVFPDHMKYDPERWIKAAAEGVQLRKYITNFSQGSRQCLGINMSHAELYMAVSRITRQFDFELYDTTDADLDITHARIVGYPKINPNKLRPETTGEIHVNVLKKYPAVVAN